MPALQQLRDIHLPSAINTWPLAFGWLFLYGLIVVIIFLGIIKLLINKRKKLVIKSALKKLNKLKKLHELYRSNNEQKTYIISEISTLLRRTLLNYFPREMVASLSGKNWLDFLTAHVNVQIYDDEIAELLTLAPYQKTNDKDLSSLFKYVEAYLIGLSKHNIKKEHK